MKAFGIKGLDLLSTLLFILSAFCSIWVATITFTPVGTDYAASRLQSRLNDRVALLEEYIDTALEGDENEWMDIDNLPSDMVIYRYYNSVLQSWANSFVIANDDISERVVVQRLSDPKNSPSSPLAEIGERYTFINLGQQWYLARAAYRGPFKVIAGLQISDDNDFREKNHINPHLKLDERYTVSPISYSGGTAVELDGSPLFKVISESLDPPAAQDSVLRWVALLLFICASMVMLISKRTLKRFAMVCCLNSLAIAWMFFLGMELSEASRIFSPVLYADGLVFYSLAAVIILNLAILSYTVSLYLVRRTVFRHIMQLKHPKLALILSSCSAFIAVALIVVYAMLSFSSIVMNSNIVLELYRLSDLSFFTAIVYVSYLSMLLSIPMLIQLQRPVLKIFSGRSYPVFTTGTKVLLSLMISSFLVAAAAVLSFHKEESQVEIWSDRMAMDRDIILELSLRMAEDEIAGDPFIASLSILPNASSIVTNRILNSYLTNVSKGYDVSTLVMDGRNSDPAMAAFISDRVTGGVKIHNQSRFLYSTSGSGRSRYTGLFTYFIPNYGQTFVLVIVESKDNRTYLGYNELLGLSSSNSLPVQQRYSYARYGEGKLLSYKGTYPYPTLMTDQLESLFAGSDKEYFEKNGYIHFVNHVSDEEFIVVSRPKGKNSNYLVAVVFLSLVFYLLMHVFTGVGAKRRPFKNAYYKRRISVVLMSSLIITLVSLAGVSMYFVFERNDKNIKETMAEKINSIQTVMSTSVRYVNSYREVNPQDLSGMLETASNMSKSDITLYNTSGRAFLSTASEVFDRMYISDRVNDSAYREIVYNHKRYVINKERAGSRAYTALYAPLFNDEGNMVAIVSTPFSDDNYDFRYEAIMHAVSLFSVFIILLLLARFMVSSIVDRMFKPVLELGRKMDGTSVEKLEYLEYDREDELSSLVRSYNMMVHDLSESTRKLAQAERDNAWNSMARQVAHEIKNPLTPMKLQLQRLVRLKQRNAEGWEDKFDDVAGIVLQHIDILSDTANEFSTFAKLATEEPVRFNIDKLLKQEIIMFDNKDNIEFHYLGLEGAEIVGPKPQLTRTLVNLLTNSVQAIDIYRNERIEAGQEAEKGIINVSLRNSVREGWYDIVIEDNGPGVKPENMDKLFTPNFTTKSSGTGLGLAICRSIIEKCGAEISYSKSFSLSGACFTICYPKAPVL